MTNNEIIEVLAKAGVKASDKLNRKQLEALAVEKGVSLTKPPEEVPPEEVPPEEVPPEDVPPEDVPPEDVPPEEVPPEESPPEETPPESGAASTTVLVSDEDEEDDDEPRDRIEVLEALLRVRGREVKIRPALGGGGFQAVCQEFPDLVGLGEDEEDAIAELFEAIDAAPVPDAAAYDPGRIITPVMAVCAIAGDAAAVPENGQGEA